MPKEETKALWPRLVERLADVYPGSEHVYRIGLDQASDLAVWNTARGHGFTIVSQDADFSDISACLERPLNVIWIRRGNCCTRDIEAIFRLHFDVIRELHKNSESRILALC